MTINHITENWRHVTGYLGLYLVSDQGKIKTLHKSTVCNPGDCLKPGKISGGYLGVALSRNNVKSSHKVHRLVLEAFVGPCPSGHQCHHINGDKTDNRLENLEWVTPLYNIRNSPQPNTPRGSKCHFSKLVEREVEEINTMLVNGWTHKSIAKKYNVARSTISRINQGTTWSHVQIQAKAKDPQRPQHSGSPS
jgi:hypothetical protein